MSKYVKYVLLCIFLALQSPPLLAETNNLTKVKTDCQSKGHPFWNCDCIVEKYQQAKTANPDQSFSNLLAKIYPKSCFDKEKIKNHYLDKKCQRINRYRKLKKEPQIDCSCYATQTAEKIATTKAFLITQFAKLAAASERECQIKE